MQQLHLYDTYTRSLREFKPLQPAEPGKTALVGLYTCGPTVYDYAHVGNLRAYIFEDILRRVLEFNGFQVKHVMNITDVGHLVSDGDTGEDKIECSAMSTKYLGSYFDIHCGGEDHIPVHHTNEIAQTQACYGTRLANFWLHCYFLQLDESRMSKSSGEFIRLQNLIDRGIDPLAYRFFLLGAHYRSKLNFHWESLDGAATGLLKLQTIAYELGQAGTIDEDCADQFRDLINDDLNLPRALALTWELVKSDLPDSTKKATLLLFDRVLGLRLAEWQPVIQRIPEDILKLAQQRQEARLAKQWQEADALRHQIHTAGFEIEDTLKGPRIKVRKFDNQG